MVVTMQPRSNVWNDHQSPSRYYAVSANNVSSFNYRWEGSTGSIPYQIDKLVFNLNLICEGNSNITLRCSDIAAKVQQQDDVRTTLGLSKELYTTALELASELKALAAETPDSWWIRNLDQVETDDVVHFMHYVLLMRIYLPFAFQEEPIEADYSSRLACMAACEGVAQRYQFLRQRLPYGFLLAHILDLQAFTATVILLLTTHGPLPADFCGLNSDKVGVGGGTPFMFWPAILCSSKTMFPLETTPFEEIANSSSTAGSDRG
jgi:hypothetical protein